MKLLPKPKFKLYNLKASEYSKFHKSKIYYSQNYAKKIAEHAPRPSKRARSARKEATASLL